MANRQIKYTLGTEQGTFTVIEDIRLAGNRAKGMVLGYDELTDNGDDTWSIEGVVVQSASDNVDNIKVGAVTEINSAEDTIRMVRSNEAGENYRIDADYATGLVTPDEYNITSTTTILFVDSQGDFECIDPEEFEDADWNLEREFASTVAQIDAAGDIEWILHDISGELDAPYIIPSENDVSVVDVPNGVRTIVTGVAIEDANGNDQDNKPVRKGEVLDLEFSVANNYAVEVYLTGAVFNDGEKEATRTFEGGSHDVDILVDGTDETVTATFRLVSGRANLPAQTTAGTITDGTHTTSGQYVVTFSDTVSGAADKLEANVGDTVTMTVTAKAAPAANTTDTIGLYFGNTLLGEVSFGTPGAYVNQYQTVEFTVTEDMMGGELTLSVNSVTAQAPKVEHVQAYKDGDPIITSADMKDATALVITFDKALDANSIESATFTVDANGAGTGGSRVVTNKALSPDGKTVTVTFEDNATYDNLFDGATVKVDDVTSDGVEIDTSANGATYKSADHSWTVGAIS